MLDEFVAYSGSYIVLYGGGENKIINRDGGGSDKADES